MSDLAGPADTRLERPRALLAHRYFGVLAATLGALLSLPVLTTGYQADDLHDYSRSLTDPLSVLRRPVLTPERVRAGQERGALPWWTSPNARSPAKLRPLGALDLSVDIVLWPGNATAAHAHSVVVYFLLILAISGLFRALLGPTWMAGLATLMYAVDDAHGLTVGYLHGRSGLIAVLFVALASTSYVRLREQGWKPGWVLGPLAFAVGLATYEAGILAFAVLFAHAGLRDRAPLRERLYALSPYLLVGLAWMLIYASGESASRQSGMYTDPLSEPLQFAVSVFRQLPLYMASTLLIFPTDPFIFFGPERYWTGWAVALVAVAAVLFALRRVLRRDREAQFWLLLLLLGAGPACGAFPNDRLLMVAQLGAFGLVVHYLSRSGDPSLPGTRGLVTAFVVCHLVAAPLLLPVRSLTMEHTFGRVGRLALHTLEDMAHLDGRTLLVLNAPDMVLGLIPALTAARGWIAPSAVTLGGISREAVHIERESAQSLVIRTDGGYLMDLSSTFLRNPRERFTVGEEVAVPAARVEVVSTTPDGRPDRVRFDFGQTIEEAPVLIVLWSGQGYRVFEPPPTGQSSVEPAIDYRRLMLDF